jgi:mono/diheme cytochrome c family protein
MKRIVKKTLLVSGIVLAGAAGVLTIAVAARQHRTFQAPYPAIHASADPAVIARGRYLAFGAAHCADCHGDPNARATLESGAEIALSGGMEFRLPVGKFRVPNITPDARTGIGRYRDEELARILRHGVHADNRGVLPFMPFADLSDADLTAIISFLRAQPAVEHAVAPHAPNVLGRIMLAFVIEPRGPTQPVRASVEPAPTAEYGRYLVHNVGNCVNCHTKVDMRTGALAGPLLGGGAVHEALDDPSKKFVAPNLTPDPRWGWIASWPEEVFVARIHMGRQRDKSPMPWHAFKRMSDDDLRAVFRYLRTVPPVAGGPDPGVQDAVVVAQR